MLLHATFWFLSESTFKTIYRSIYLLHTLPIVAIVPWKKIKNDFFRPSTQKEQKEVDIKGKTIMSVNLL